VELPESASWHPLEAAKVYQQLAEEAAGLYANAFKEYGRLKPVYRAGQQAAAKGQERIGRSSSAIDYTWKDTDIAKSLVSDMNTYSLRAQVMAAMATMKFAEYSARRTLGEALGLQVPE
jgi:hypothetical protein